MRLIVFLNTANKQILHNFDTVYVHCFRKYIMHLNIKFISLASLFILFFFTAGQCFDKTSTSNSIDTITNILIKTNQSCVVIYWAGVFDYSRETTIAIYRTEEKITNANEIAKVPPYKKMTNEFFFEDPDISFGVPYYYLIIVNENMVILPGKNVNSEPVFFGATNGAGTVDVEVLSSTNENYSDFIKKFK